MSDVTKDPAIKLFGRTIAVPDGQTAALMLRDYPDLAETVESCELEKDICREETNTEAKDQMDENYEDVDHDDGHAPSDINDGNSVDNKEGALDGNTTTDSKPGQEQVAVDVSSEEKVLKKPDKLLPCPRCNSMDTKFCYYNNYNVNQPRHFCKNCQRYWTAGGTMRNVPVGAGRRKSKHSSSHYRHLVISSDGLPSPRGDNPDSGHKIHSHGQSSSAAHVNGNGSVLNFARDAPLCESMANVLIADQKRKVEVNLVTCSENVKEPSCASSVTASKCKKNDECVNQARPEQTIVPGTYNGLTPINPLQCYPAPPWAFPWNAAGWGNMATIAAGRCTTDTCNGQENDGPKIISWTPPPVMAAPAFCPPTMPYPFFPASFWGCVPPWPGAWNAQCVGGNGNLSPSLSTSNRVNSGNDSPKLGKHSRDTGSNVTGKTEKSLWIPKTLRIDDPDDAAKSSIWATLGIKHDGHDTIAKGGIFKSFQPRIGIEDHRNDASQVLHANPAALSRSNKFQEST